MEKVARKPSETSVTVKPSRQQRRYARTRDRLLSAARTVFSEKGLGASVDEIAVRADVARGSFYYHFQSKERLIRMLVDEMLTELVERMNAECSGREDLESVLDGIIQTHIEYFSSRWKEFVLYYQGRADLTLEQPWDGIEKPFIKYAKSMERLVDACIPEQITDTTLRRIANAIAGFISGYYSFASVASTDQDVDREFMSLRRAFVNSMARFTREAVSDSLAKK